MTRQTTAYQAAKKAVPKFDQMGGFPDDFAKKISRNMPFGAAMKLLTIFPKLLDADGREARCKGRGFEAAHYDGWRNLTADECAAKTQAHREKSSRPTSRDRKFAGALPKSLRAEFYDVVKRDKEYEYGWGEHTVFFNRTLKRIDAMRSTPAGRWDWEMKNEIEYRRRFEMGG